MRYKTQMGVISTIRFLLHIRFAKWYKETSIDISIYCNATAVRLRLESSDVVTFEKIFVWQEYAFSHCSKASIIMDCGANAGFSAMWYALGFPYATIIALEPDEDNYKMLLKNTEAFANVLPIHCGLWSRECRLVNVSCTTRADSYHFCEGGSHATRSVRGSDVDSIRRRFLLGGVDILKIDIEGAEEAVFTEACASWLESTACLVIEIHGEKRRELVELECSAFMERHFALGENDVFVRGFTHRV